MSEEYGGYVIELFEKSVTTDQEGPVTIRKFRVFAPSAGSVRRIAVDKLTLAAAKKWIDENPLSETEE
ncbi:MAG: hypothetical protein ACYS8X_04980 [Planctomycetota bacterium]|jgi:ABC-type transport system involved in cytochrome c biogenesis ATPase subunit